jgi:hypothetical protein
MQHRGWSKPDKRYWTSALSREVEEKFLTCSGNYMLGGMSITKASLTLESTSPGELEA